MSDTKKIDTFSFNPNYERPLDKVIIEADKMVFPPKDELKPVEERVPSIQIEQITHYNIVLGEDGKIYRVMPDGNRIEIVNEDIKKKVIEESKGKGGPERVE